MLYPVLKKKVLFFLGIRLLLEINMYGSFYYLLESIAGFRFAILILTQETAQVMEDVKLLG